MDNFIEKSIDLTLPGADYEIKKHIVLGWCIHRETILYSYLRKTITEETT